jgi:hypothetical protein
VKDAFDHLGAAAIHQAVVDILFNVCAKPMRSHSHSHERKEKLARKNSPCREPKNMITGMVSI